jgi:hypothetical protein
MLAVTLCGPLAGGKEKKKDVQENAEKTKVYQRR